ncbi:hypothetical protein KCU66_g8, partial [Aureobasidium melanogenum]
LLDKIKQTRIDGSATTILALAHSCFSHLEFVSDHFDGVGDHIDSASTSIDSDADLLRQIVRSTGSKRACLAASSVRSTAVSGHAICLFQLLKKAFSKLAEKMSDGFCDSHPSFL